jgi:hypothetical protein
MHELSGNMHMHTPYSDGEKYHAAIAEDAIKAGLDFVIVTDHNIWVEEVDGYYENGDGRVLLFTGEEIHNVRRWPQASHFLALGAEKELSTFAQDPQRLINETINAGGFGFLAHPHEKDIPIVNEPNLGWHDWEIEGFTGLEIWNYMSSMKNRLAEALENLRWQNRLTGNLTALRIALHPERAITGPEPETLTLWDNLLAQGKQIVAIGNSDAHGTPMSMGPIKREIYPYEFLFRAVNTHILTKNPLSGDLEDDKKMILRAIGRGNAWVGYDMAHPTKGFKFSAKGKNKGVMGDRIMMDAGATLQVRTPARADIRLIRHGETVSQVENETTLIYLASEPGAYRVECEIPYKDKNRGWIYSNPIYLF